MIRQTDKPRMHSSTLIDHTLRWRLPSISFRTPIIGPEKHLVDWCIENLPFAKKPGHHTTVFREPRVKSGFPDLVIVSWDAEVARWWPAARMALSEHDIRLIHYLATIQARSASEAELAIVQMPSLRASLDRLQQSQMIVLNRNRRWALAGKLCDIFAIRQIVTVEAKMAGGDRVLEQAFANTWFSSLSYVLLPKQPNPEVLARAKHLGLGIVTRDEGVLLKSSSHHSAKCRPQSYGAWMFNEWVWKANLKNIDSL